MENQQNLTSSPKASVALALNESKHHQNKLDEMLVACLTLQKLYGRDVANTETVIELFQRMMAKYPAERVIKAFETWIERSQEFPTPSDIANLIRRDGKPPLKESDIIAIRKKDGEDRTRADWAMLEEWEAQQRDGWSDIADEKKDQATLDDNIRLRQRVKELEAEAGRAWDEVKRLRPLEGMKVTVNVPLDTEQAKAERTIAAMQAEGAKQEDIEAFAGMYGIKLEAA